MEEAPAVQTTPRAWSPYQQAIFDAVREGTNSLLVEAVAGSGKTTTIVEAINHVLPSKSVCFLAFNKSIAEELKRRVTAPNARCMTLHAAGFNAWRGHLAWDAHQLRVDSRKTSGIVGEVLDSDEQWAFGGEIGKLVGLAKQAGLVPLAVKGLSGLVEDDNEVWEEIVEFYGLDEDKWDEEGIEVARKVLAESIARSREVIDFDDMLYMPIVSTGAAFEQYDVVFLDEAQDVSGIQVEMVARMTSGGGRVVGVGDRHQAIYGFRGALSNSMDQIAERFGCEPLPLSVSYRCPRKVVKHVQQWVPQVEWFEGAEEGTLAWKALVESAMCTHCDNTGVEPVETSAYPPEPCSVCKGEILKDWPIGEFKPGDAILCRIARPAVALTFRLIRNKIPARMIGRDIGQGLVKLVDKMKATDLDDLLKRLAKWREREVLKAKGDEGKIAAADDKIETLRVFIDELPPTAGIGRLKQSIEALFGEAQDGARMVTLSTVHKAKGLEWDRVFILDAHEHMPSKWARQPWQVQQEQNLMYVAATRARKELYYVDGGGGSQ